MRARTAVIGLSVTPLLALLAPTDPPRPDPRRNAPPGARDDATCRVCHPGPTRGLARSPHAALLAGPASCSSCHGTVSEHVESALDPTTPVIAPARVAAAACATCHTEAAFSTAAAAHPQLADPRAGAPRDRDPVAPTTAPIAERGFAGLDWSALVAAGYRFVNRDGSRDRYKTDVNLDRGFRLSEFELSGKGGDGAALDLFRVHAEDLADPYQRIGARVEKKESFTADAGYRKSAVTYRAAGDYHRVDQKTGETSFDLSLDLTEDLQVFGGFQRFSQDGFWLTNRIGNRNVTPQTTIDGVESPRRYDADLSEIGVSGDLGDTDFSVAFGYREDRQRDRWTYDRTSAINPLFPESEDFTSRSSLRGPQVRASLGHRFGPLTLNNRAQVLDLDRRILGSGTAAGFDTTDFVTTTNSIAGGEARTWLIDTTATLEVSDDVALQLDTRWLDHEENLSIDQTDVTVFPSLNTTTTVGTLLDQRTSQRMFEGSVQLDVRPHDALDLTVGYGFAREWLRVPDLEAGDNDFRRGSIRNDGVLLGFAWRPDAAWTVRGSFRDFGQNGVQLHDIVDDQARRAEGQIRYRTEDLTLATFVKHHHRDNDISRSRTDATSTGLSGTLHFDEDADLHASWTYADIESRTLTNFYFDPDPNPVATFVGFDGQTQTMTAGLGFSPGERVRWRFDGSYTSTDGSYAIDLLDLRAEVTVRVTAGGEVGVRARWLDYEEAGGTDDYDATLALVYWRQRL